MKTRLFLPMLLIVVVFMLTPVLFPGKPRVPATPAPSAQSATPTSTERSPTPTSGNAPTAAGRPSSAAPPVIASVRADTAVISTPRVRYRVSNVGGSLVGVEFPGYHRLSADSSLVELARTDETLLRFRMVSSRDTIALDQTVLARESAADPLAVTYRGTVRDMSVAVRWSFAPDTIRVNVGGEEQPVGYLSRVEVTAQNAPPGTYLLVDLPRGFHTTEADSSTDFQHLAYAFKRVNGGADLIRFGSLDPGERDLRPGPLAWAVAKSKYFLIGVLATSDENAFAELDAVGTPRTSKMVTSGHATVVMAMRDGSAAFDVYAGPQEWRRLRAVGHEFETSNPYGGWLQGIVQPFATIVMRILLWMKGVFGLNYGWILILFGVLIRVVLWPLNQWAMRSTMKMQRVQPEIMEVQKKHAGNPEALQKAIWKVYSDHGMSPFSPLAGCLPMLIPMPVLFALFFVFQNTIEFRGVAFWWMTDISQKDPLFVIPVVMGLSMFATSWIGMRNLPPNPQAKMLMYIMPVMLTVLFFYMAAGLNLYYTAQNLATIPQQWLIANERAKAATAKSG
ncbi:MAG TPA: membrane protein insertase YidC [Gemmatimonadaceae bacterium]|nr:membrane protein insertase YidC [Gemmatimonadaceae bacterium]